MRKQANKMRFSLCIIFRQVFLLAMLCFVHSVSANIAINPDTNRTYNEIVIGGLGIKGKDALFDQWNDTFSVYLSKVVGPAFGVTFKLVYLDFTTTYEAVERRDVDMVYTNPSVYACLEREHRAAPIASLRNRRKVGDAFYELDHFYGAMIVKHNSPITKIAEIANKTVEAVSLIGLGACQLQWDELTDRGISFLGAPRQVRFSSSQKKTVKNVISGAVDIGMVRTDLAEAMVSDGEIDPGSIRVLENLQGRLDDPEFPFPHSTRLAAPEWTLGSLPWTSWNLSRAVSQALMSITPEDQAAISGKYATWVPPLSSLGMHEMQAKLNWIDSNNKCIRAGDVCDMVVCPPDQLKKSCEQIMHGCQDIGEPCPEGYTCLCNPCHPVVDKNCSGRANFEFRETEAKCMCRFGFEQPPGKDVCIEMASKASNTSTIVVAIALVMVVLVILVAAWIYRLRRRKRDDSWKISLDELKFPEPCVVLGRGTYGQVLQADFRSTLVAVKRVMPKMRKEGSATSAATVRSLLSFSNKLHVTVADLQMRGAGRSGPSQGSGGDEVGSLRTAFADDTTINNINNINKNKNISQERRNGAGESQVSGSSRISMPASPVLTKDEVPLAKSPLGQAQMANKALGEGQSYRIKRRASTNRPGRASEMQLQVHRQETARKQDSALSGRDSSWSDSMKNRVTKALGFRSHAQEAPPHRLTGHQTTIDCTQLKDLTKEFMREMQVKIEDDVMVYLRHPNIVTVMGAVVDKESEPLMVMEHMKHGSLYDLMHNHTMQFDSEITMGVLEGIISGMMYLHSAKPPVLHNDLKSGNVLVGVNFAAKLADFGLSMKRKSSGFLGTPFWMAPELLTSGSQPSVKTDIYSFGMTLYELLTRKEPYEEHNNVQDIIDMLGDADMDPPLRPTLPEGIPKDAAAIVCACWDPDPDMRPSFDKIKVMVSQLDMKDLDVWFGRQNSGAAGKRTANQLLYDVFPSHIADTLRQGKKVEPEHHEVVTIFFSDIVGFTDISRALQPIEVMEMLDRLYAKFDAIARKHDIFKVETIGDAYMAVANLVKDQSNHTELIAKFAMDAIQTANATMIKDDQPDLGCVNIRVGFHSGPVVSSVVGNMNPRFCLFGDTVNTSSRMESNSEKNRIHMSDTAAALLIEQAPGAQLTNRGVTSIKGKGDMNTYWLDGFEENDEPSTQIIPDVAQEASLAQ